MSVNNEAIEGYVRGTVVAFTTIFGQRRLYSVSVVHIWLVWF